MQKTLLLGCYLAVLLLRPALADPLTFYYDQSSWLAAASGFQIGPYSSASTEIDTYETVIYGNPFVPVGTSSSTKFTPNGGFSNVGGGPLYFLLFTFPPFCNPSAIGCIGTGLRDISITLNSPINGFEGNLAIADGSGSGTILLNGMPLDPTPERFGYTGFFGAIGSVSTLDFQCACLFTDNPLGFTLSNVQVAVDEPPSIALFSGILFLLLVGPFGGQVCRKLGLAGPVQ